MASIVGPVLNIYGGEPTDGVDGWRIAMNTSLAKMDAVISLSVKSRSYSKPVSNISSGDRYLVMDQASWDNQPVGTIAVYGKKPDGTSGWNYYSPINGMVCYVIDEAFNYQYLSGVWNKQNFNSSSFILPNIGEFSGSYVTGQSGNFLIDSFDKTIYGACEYLIYVKRASTSYKQVSKFIVTHDDATTTQLVDYAKIYSDQSVPLATFSSDIVGNNVRLIGTALYANLTVRVVKILINI